MQTKQDTKGHEPLEKAFRVNQAVAEKTANAGSETGERMLRAGTEAGTKAYDQASAASNEQMQKLFPQFAGSFNEMTGFQKANLEALAAAGMVAVKGIESLSGELFAFNRKMIEDSLANAKRLFECKTINQLAEVQADLTRANLEQVMAQGTRITELTVKLANEVAAPIQARAGEAVGKMSKPLAA